MGYPKEPTNIGMAVEQLEDEVEGIDAYKNMYEMATCPTLKQIALEHLAAEKQHALSLSKYIHDYISTAG